MFSLICRNLGFFRLKVNFCKIIDYSKIEISCCIASCVSSPYNLLHSTKQQVSQKFQQIESRITVNSIIGFKLHHHLQSLIINLTVMSIETKYQSFP